MGSGYRILGKFVIKGRGLVCTVEIPPTSTLRIDDVLYDAQGNRVKIKDLDILRGQPLNDTQLINWAVAVQLLDSTELCGDYLYTEKELSDKEPSDEFVERVAQKVYKRLGKKDKKYILKNPDSTFHHFGLGMAIRNQYIHGKDLGFDVFDPDDLSSEIMEKIISLVRKDYGET